MVRYETWPLTLKVFYVYVLTKASVPQTDGHGFDSPLGILLFFSIFTKL